MPVKSRATSLAHTVSRRSSFTDACLDFECFPTPNYLFQTKSGKRWQKIRMSILPILPLLALLIQSSVRLWNTSSAVYRIQEWKDDLNNMKTLGTVIAAVQEERDVVMAYLYFQNDTTLSTLYTAFDKTDAVLKDTQTSVLPTQQVEECRAFLNPAREAARLKDAQKDSFRIFTNYSKAIAVLTNYNDRGFIFPNARMLSLKAIERGVERLLSIRILGVRYFLMGILGPGEFTSFAGSNKVATESLVASVVYDQDVQSIITRRLDNCSCDVTNMVREIISNKKTATQISVMNKWYNRMKNQIIAYNLVKDDIRVSLEGTAEIEYDDAVLNCIGDVIMMILCLSGFPICCLIAIKIINNGILYVSRLIERRQVAKFEKRKTDDLLHQMLPKSVVMQLKFHKKVEAEKFDSVTVFFSDIKNFAHVSTISTPMQLVNLLNAVYNHVDNIIDRFDVYKVETINETYMVCSGLPVRNGINHVKEIASLSLELMDSMEDFKIPHLREERAQLRVGLNSGPCVAGVVGTKMPRYCLFGDTVNVAARMQTNSLPMKIHISQQTEQLLSQIGGYITEYRGKVMIKGKGQMSTYWLIAREAPGSRSSSIKSNVMFEHENGGPSSTTAF